MKEYDPSKNTKKSRRKLPHWQQHGCTYFITFRLHDSIPSSKLTDWNEERQRWLRSRGLDPSQPLDSILNSLKSEQKKIYYDTFWKGYHDMLDNGLGACELRDPANAKIVVDTLLFFDNERYLMDDFIVMPNHVHLLVTPFATWTLSKLLHSWKRYTARQINERMQQDGVLWQPESYDHIVRNEEQLKRIKRYIKNNPKNLKLDEYYYYDSRTAL